MPAEPLRILKSSFLIGELNSMFVRGKRLDEVAQAAIFWAGSTEIEWVNFPGQVARLDARRMLISGTPRLISGETTPGLMIYGEVAVVLLSVSGEVRTLRTPAFYYSV